MAWILLYWRLYAPGGTASLQLLVHFVAGNETKASLATITRTATDAADTKLVFIASDILILFFPNSVTGTGYEDTRYDVLVRAGTHCHITEKTQDDNGKTPFDHHRSVLVTTTDYWLYSVSYYNIFEDFAFITRSS